MADGIKKYLWIYKMKISRISQSKRKILNKIGFEEWVTSYSKDHENALLMFGYDYEYYLQGEMYQD